MISWIASYRLVGGALGDGRVRHVPIQALLFASEKIDEQSASLGKHISGFRRQPLLEQGAEGREEQTPPPPPILPL